MTYVRCGAVIGFVALFLWYFDSATNQPLVDSCWVLAIVVWGLQVKALSPAPWLGIRPRRADLVPLVLILAIFAAAWLPFFDNWRWAYTGDSFGVFASGYWLGKNGLQQNILSVHGIDDCFTVLWSVSYNWLMRLFGPTLFWHRCGQVIMACLALTAIYAFFTRVLGRMWGAAIVVATAINYVWLWFTYVSYLKIDSFIFYYLALTWATLIWYHPERLGLWMLGGLTAGLSLLFTPTAWSGVIFVSVGLGIFALVTRRFGALTVFTIAFLLAAIPILREVPWLLTMTRSQTAPNLDRDYLERMFKIILFLPYASPLSTLGAYGAFLKWPLGPLYLVGLGIAALSTVAPLRRRLRAPGITPVLLALLLWDVTLLTFTNKGYGNPSHKRAYNLIPLQVFFALLPAYVLYAWSRRYRWARAVTLGLTAVALAVYGYANVELMAFPPAHLYGTNIFDGLIELRQRFPQQPLVVITSPQCPLATLPRETLFQDVYKILDNVTLTDAFTDATVTDACRQHAVICYDTDFDQPKMQPLLESHQGTLRSFPLLNSVELVCYGCV